MAYYISTRDFAHTGEEFVLEYIPDLDMLLTRDPPQNPDPYYGGNYISHSDRPATATEKVYHLIKKIALKKKVKWISSMRESHTNVLDVGTGTGDFLVKAKQKGWSVTGVEPYQSARDKALAKGIPVYGDLNSCPDQTYGAITLWHVLEHLPELEDRINQLVSLLAPAGTLFIAVPNFKSYDAQYYGRFWAAYDVPRHLWHFSKNAISKIFAKKGFKVIGIKPMIFDAFYVSLLSEKYKNGRWHYIKALFIGLWSNLRAWRTGEYSSLLYILRRE